MQGGQRPPAGDGRGSMATGVGAPGRERALPRAVPPPRAAAAAAAAGEEESATAGRQGGGGHRRGPAEARGAQEEGRDGGRRVTREGADAGGADGAPEAEGGPQGGAGRPPLPRGFCVRCWRDEVFASPNLTVHARQTSICLPILRSIVGVSLTLLELRLLRAAAQCKSVSTRAPGRQDSAQEQFGFKR